MNNMKRRISPRRISSLSTSASSVSSNSSSDNQDTQEEDNVDDAGIGNNTASLEPSSSTETSDHYCIPIKFGKEDSHEVQSSSSSSASASNTNEDTNKPNLFEPPIRISNSISISKEDTTSNTTSNTNPSNKKKSSAVLSPPPSSLTFSPLVKVIPIPSHKTYPPNVHSQLYQSKYEMTCNAARNTREYIYEGWGDFNNVIEEDGMYSMSKMNGTMLVHPVHIVDYIAARRI